MFIHVGVSKMSPRTPYHLYNHRDDTASLRKDVINTSKPVNTLICIIMVTLCAGSGGEPGVLQVRSRALDRGSRALPVHRHAGPHLRSAHLRPGRRGEGFRGL